MNALLALSLLLSPDLSPKSAEWDGLARWTQALIARGVTVSAPPTLSALGQGGGVALLDPQGLDLPTLLAFVDGGGRALLAVEADSLPALGALKISPVALDPSAPRLGDHPALAVATSSAHPALLPNLALVTNRPVGLTVPEGATVLLSAGGTPLGVALPRGQGVLLVVGDTSWLTNLMQDAGDNEALGLALGRWLAGPEGRLLVVTPATALEGTLGGRPPRTLADRLADLLDALQSTPPPAWMVRVEVALLALFFMGFCLSLFTRAEPSVPPPISPAHPAERRAGGPGGPANPEAAERRAGPAKSEA